MKRNIKNTLKTAALGLAVFAGVIALQSFEKNASAEEIEKKETKTVLAPNFLVNKGATFSPRSTVNPSTNCDVVDTRNCVYQLTAEGMENVPDQASYSSTEIDEYQENGWITPHPQSGLALYQN